MAFGSPLVFITGRGLVPCPCSLAAQTCFFSTGRRCECGFLNRKTLGCRSPSCAAYGVRPAVFLLFLSVVQFHETSPERLAFLSGVMAEQRFFSDGFPDLFCRNLALGPFEDQYAVRFKHSHTFAETVMQHLRPGFIEFPVLFDEPCCFVRVQNVGGGRIPLIGNCCH